MEWSHWNCYNKCNTYLYIVSRIKLYLSTDNRKHIYSPSFWLLLCYLGKLHTLPGGKTSKTSEKGCPRILDCDFYTPSYTRFSDLKWMSFPERVIYMKAIQMLKTIRGYAPEYLRLSFTFASHKHARLLRSSSNFQLYTPKSHLEIYRNTFVFSGSSVWNSLP